MFQQPLPMNPAQFARLKDTTAAFLQFLENARDAATFSFDAAICACHLADEYKFTEPRSNTYMLTCNHKYTMMQGYMSLWRFMPFTPRPQSPRRWRGSGHQAGHSCNQQSTVRSLRGSHTQHETRC